MNRISIRITIPANFWLIIAFPLMNIDIHPLHCKVQMDNKSIKLVIGAPDLLGSSSAKISPIMEIIAMSIRLTNFNVFIFRLHCLDALSSRSSLELNTKSI